MGSMPVVPILATTLALALATPASVAAQAATVYRCADAVGQVTYQQEPCASGTKGRAVEILPDNGLARDSATLESQWGAAAKQGVVSLGMPRRYVRDALGTPAETRQGLPVERATEVWTYRYGDGARRIGFLDGRVTWDRAGDGNTLPAQPAAPRPAQSPAPQAAAVPPPAAPVPAPQVAMVPPPVASVQPVALPQAPSPILAAQPRASVAQPSSVVPPQSALPPGVQQDPSGVIVMRRPDALPLEGSGAGQPAVRVLSLPSQSAAQPQRQGAQSALAPLSSTASTWSPPVSAQGAAPQAGAPGAPAPGTSMPAGRSDAMMTARQAIRPGTSCAAVIAQAGAPDRTDTIRVPAPGGGGEVPAARHTYASDGSDPPRDVAFTCVGGIVREVERGVR